MSRRTVTGNWLMITTCLAAVGLLGCGGGGKGPKTVPVSGTVTYKNAPVAGANVAFLGDGQTAPAMAITDTAGEFVLTTTNPGDGAVPGLHKVTVTKKVSAPKKASDPSANSMEGAVKKFHESQGKTDAPQALSMIPEHYSEVSSSGLQFKVEEGKENTFKIELTD